MNDDWTRDAERLSQLLRTRGIDDERVLARIATVPRQRFVPDDLAAQAYVDTALSIGQGQTISQPYIVALMTSALKLEGWERVLEIGTGSGYQTAILCGLAREVFTIERLPALASAAENRLRELSLTNFHARVADGSLGWQDEAPFDGILVTAASPKPPTLLLDQLTLAGRLVVPVGPAGDQSLLVYRREGTHYVSDTLCSCRFVKLIGEQGFRETSPIDPTESKPST